MGPVSQVAGLVVLAGALILAAVWIILRDRMSPEKRERQRRLTLNRRGRLADGTITEANAATLYYSYAISGVVYTASQDISALYQYLPADPERLIGPVWLKYSTRNPENSILICEHWSGLRTNSKQGEANV